MRELIREGDWQAVREWAALRCVDMIDESSRKVESGRMTDPKAEQARQGWHNEENKAIRLLMQISRDSTLSELTERVETLEAEDGRIKVKA